MNKFLSRKFLFCTLTVILESALLYVGVLPAQVYGAIVGAVVTGYLISNVSQKAIKE